jgi:hypothetical protein
MRASDYVCLLVVEGSLVYKIMGMQEPPNLDIELELFLKLPFQGLLFSLTPSVLATRKLPKPPN